MTDVPAAFDPPIRRAKLLPPPRGDGLVSRPRLTAHLDQSLRAPLTLIAAPAGFGKTTLLSEWAGSQRVPLGWLTLDARDRDLRRFLPHLIAMVQRLLPGLADTVLDQQRRGAGTAAELGAALADALLDLPHDIVIVIDDYHLAASTAVEGFLGGLLQHPAPACHLLLATRSDPALPLSRMRLHGHVRELRAEDLRFQDAEVRSLLAGAGHAETDPALVAALQHQTGGWIAGLRLAALALPAVADLERLGDVVAGDQHVMDYLVEEVLASQPAATQDFLLRTAILDRVCADLADGLCATPPGANRALLERLARERLFLEPAGSDEWLHFHPLFRTLLLHQLESRYTAQEIASLHARAGDWFAAHDLLDLAVRHRILAGDVAGAGTLVEQHARAALDREDWITVARWLRLLPEAVVHSRPGLLLARAWVSHFSGRSVPIGAMFAALDALLAAMDASQADRVAAWQAERDAISIAARLRHDRDAESTVAFARRAVAHVPPDHRLAAGLAGFGLGCALQAAGRTEEAIHWLTEMAERNEERIDAGSIRAMGGLMWVHRQAGNVRACAETAQLILRLAVRHELPVAAGWAHWMLGWLAYERNALETASEHFTAIMADRERVHFHCTGEAMLGLALTYQARGLPTEAASTLRQFLELIFDANALEYLPLARGFAARLALLQGDLPRACDWLTLEDGATITSSSLDTFDHAHLTRIKVLLAEGSAASLARARQDLAAARAYTAAHHHQAHEVEILVLTALAHHAQGESGAARAAMTRAVALAADADQVRAFVDLGAMVLPLLQELAAQGDAIPSLPALIAAVAGDGALHDPEQSPTIPGGRASLLDTLTLREAEVLACLQRRLSYQEIAAELFISPQTVKSHITSIYSKLGAGGRRQALVKAQALGWLAEASPIAMVN